MTNNKHTPTPMKTKLSIVLCFFLTGCSSSYFFIGYIPMSYQSSGTKFKYLSTDTSLKSQVEAFNGCPKRWR